MKSSFLLHRQPSSTVSSWWKGWGALWSLFFHKGTNPTNAWRFHPHDLVTSQSCHLLPSSPWHLQLMTKDGHLWILTVHKDSFHCILQSSKINLKISVFSLLRYIMGISFNYETHLASHFFLTFTHTYPFPSNHQEYSPISFFSLSSLLFSSVVSPKATDKTKILSKPIRKTNALARQSLWYNWDLLFFEGLGATGHCLTPLV